MAPSSELGVRELAQAIRRGDLASEALVEELLARCDRLIAQRIHQPRARTGARRGPGDGLRRRGVHPSCGGFGDIAIVEIPRRSSSG